MSLIQETLCEAPWVFHQELRSRGILHGFVGKPLNFSASGRERAAAALLAALSASEIALVRQVHGDTVVALRERTDTTEADAIIFPLHTPGRRVVVGVRSADCVPLILVGAQYGVVVHAGWRGLAAKIVRTAAQKLTQQDPGPITALIGPCAGGQVYEVGAEVIHAIGDTASSVAKGNGKFLLDLTHTTRAQLREAGTCTVHAAELCTISDRRFHSYRREGAPVGNNLAFVLTMI